MLQYNPTVSGSLTITGSLTVTNGVIGTVSGVDIQIFSSSINQVITGIQVSTGSSDARLTFIETFTSSALTRLTNIESKSASVDISISNINSVTTSNIARLSNLETKSSSVDISISSINSFTSSNANTSLNSYTGSNDTKFTTLGTYTGSLDTKNTTLSSVTSSLISKTGSYATTGSNSFYGTQVFSGSVFIANDLVVQGSSSIQYISASSVSIGTNIVQLNTATPSVRYAGLAVQDSGSSAGITGSILWDSLCNRWMYSNPSTIGYSGGIIMSGPRAATLGEETTLTCNYIAKSGGGDHLYDSVIYENGGCVGIGNTSPTALLDICHSTNGYASVGLQGYTGACKWYVTSGISGTSIHSFSIGNCNNGTNSKLTITCAGNVGINLSTPSYTLDVNGVIAIEQRCFGGSAGLNIIGCNASNNYPNMGFSMQNTCNLISQGVQIEGTISSNTCGSESMGLDFYTKSSGTLSKKFTIHPAGVVCFVSTICAQSITFCSNINNGFTPIRICNPNGGSSAFSEIALFNDTATQAGLFFNSSTRTADGGVCSLSLYNDATAGSIRIRSVGCITLATGVGNTNRFSINTNGLASFCCQVGIGTTPTFTFDVFGELGVYCTGGASEGGVSIQKDTAGKGGKIQSFGASSYLVFTTNLSGTNYDRLKITSAGVVHPMANGTQDFGTSSLRWGTIYTSDLSLSNGIGDYTIVEGEDDLFLYNNKQCKVYKFMLQQVCAECATPKKS